MKLCCDDECLSCQWAVELCSDPLFKKLQYHSVKVWLTKVLEFYFCICIPIYISKVSIWIVYYVTVFFLMITMYIILLIILLISEMFSRFATF